MSTYDDWVVNFKVNTSPLDAALRKVEQLRQAMNGLHGVGGMGGGLGGGGRRTGTRQLSPEQEQAKRTREFYDSQRHLNHNQRLREQHERSLDRTHKAEIAAYKEAAKRERELAKAEIAAYTERSQRAKKLAELRQNQQYQLAGIQARQAQQRRALEQNQQYQLAGIRGAEAQRRRQLEQQQQYQLAGLNAAARQRAMDLAESQAHRENRWRNQEARRAEAQGGRDFRLGTSVMSRSMTLDRMEARMNRAGVGDRTELANLRQLLGSARNQGDIARLAPRMREFSIATNEAIRHQQSLERQLRRNNFATQSMSNSMANLARSYLSIYAVMGGGRSLYENAKKMEAMQTKLLMGTGSKAEAANEYSYIKGKAQETGTDLLSMTNLYSQMAITGKDTGMGKDTLRKVFEDVTTMQIGYGMSPEQQKLTTKAIIQMMSFSE